MSAILFIFAGIVAGFICGRVHLRWAAKRRVSRWMRLMEDPKAFEGEMRKVLKIMPRGE